MFFGCQTKTPEGAFGFGNLSSGTGTFIQGIVDPIFTRYTAFSMLHTEEADTYAKGMIFAGETDINITPTYDRWQYGLFKEFLGRRILEVGAGNGRITSHLIHDGHFDEVVATEPSPHFYDLLRKRIRESEGVKLLQATTTELLVSYREYFDTAFSVHVVEHIEDDLQVLREQLELVRPGGNVIVLVPALQFLYSELDRNIGHFRRYDKRRFRRLAAQLANCRIEKIFYSNALGVLGSFYFSKVRKINYQGSEANKQNFNRIYRLFSEYVVPYVNFIESKIPVPLGLNLTAVLRKL